MKKKGMKKKEDIWTMSNTLFEIHRMFGQPCGEHAGLDEVAEWAGHLLIIRTQKSIPLHPTPSMIEEGAKRLMRWQDNSVWPDSWDSLQRHGAMQDAERVWRSMWLMAAQTELQGE